MANSLFSPELASILYGDITDSEIYSLEDEEDSEETADPYISKTAFSGFSVQNDGSRGEKNLENVKEILRGVKENLNFLTGNIEDFLEKPTDTITRKDISMVLNYPIGFLNLSPKTTLALLKEHIYYLSDFSDISQKDYFCRLSGMVMEEKDSIAQLCYALGIWDEKEVCSIPADEMIEEQPRYAGVGESSALTSAPDGEQLDEQELFALIEKELLGDDCLSEPWFEDPDDDGD